MPSGTHLQRVPALLGLAAILVGPVDRCAFSGNSSEPGAKAPSIGVLGSGFIDPAKPPAPEATIRPEPGSWDAVHPPDGYRAVLLTAGDDPATRTLVTAVRQWATAEHVLLETVAVPARDAVDGIVEAIERRPDLIVCAGNALVDALALVTASFLDQQFLVVGAQLPEPTVNVTAAIWQGAASRGGEVPDTAASFDPSAFTLAHAGAAIRAGVASVLSDITGIVIWLDADQIIAARRGQTP